MSACRLFLEDVVNDANVFARPRSSGGVDVGRARGDGDDGRENVGWDGERAEDVSALND